MAPWTAGNQTWEPTARLAGHGSTDDYRRRVTALEAGRRDGEDWPDVPLELMTLHAVFGHLDQAAVPHDSTPSATGVGSMTGTRPRDPEDAVKPDEDS